jgi:uncharacterized protein YeaO (DUF488 family)
VNTGFRVRRVYDDHSAEDGRRVLVDRLWPRGLSRENAHLDEWAKEVAPSSGLRSWFHERPQDRYAEFARRYRAELDGPEQQDHLARLRAEAAEGPVTLLTAVKDPGHSHVTVLLARLRET